VPDLVARDKKVFFHQHGSSPCIGALAGAEGAWLIDDRGHRLLDLHGNTAHHIGYAHPRLIAALKLQLSNLVFSPRRYTNESATLLAENLTARFRGGRSKMLLATGGSDAIEIAMRLARIATGRAALVALEGAYHGHGFGALALSTPYLDHRLGAGPPDICHITPYWRDPDRMLAELEKILRQGAAALIAEPMRSNCIVPPADLWRQAAALCVRYGAKLIFDEIPSGLGKTGHFFAHEHFGVTPDIVVLGKALGGGILPIAAVLADDTMDIAPELAIGHYTHEKNPVTTRAALTTLEIIDAEGLVARAARLGAYLEKRVSTQAAFSGLRGLGLMRALELPDDSAEALAAGALSLGVSTVAKDASSVAFSPPLTIEEAEIDLALERLTAAAGVAG
jgi:4-aminobutyrate aminotransferase